MKARARTLFLLAVPLVLLLTAFLPGPATPARASAGEPRILMLMGNYVGGYHYLTSDLWEDCGWDLTSVALLPTLEPCNLGVSFHVDRLLSEITDLADYDCLAIMQARAWDGNSHADLLASPEALALVQQAVSQGLLVVATCGGVRVLAAAGVIEGRTVTGYANYAQEYRDAGATYAGDDVPPILDGNILTSAHGRYYYQQLTETMREYFAAQIAARAAGQGRDE